MVLLSYGDFMLVRWWRAQKAPHEEWQLIALRPNGSWTPLAIAVNNGRDAKRRWTSTMCMTPGGKGSTWMGSDLRSQHNRRVDAFRTAEAMCGFQERIKLVTWPEAFVGSWPYPPRSDRGRQLHTAKQYWPVLKNFQTAAAELLAKLSAVRRVATLQDVKDMVRHVVSYLSSGRLDAAYDQLLSAVYDKNAEAALFVATEALHTYRIARSALHGQASTPHRA